jgi:hypothetical protein
LVLSLILLDQTALTIQLLWIIVTISKHAITCQLYKINLFTLAATGNGGQDPAKESASGLRPA